MAAKKTVETRLSAIEERNCRVEIDKEWETSRFRKALVAIFTYFSIGTYFWAIGIERPWINALVPSLAFLVSTLAFPFFRKIWERGKKPKKQM